MAAEQEALPQLPAVNEAKGTYKGKYIDRSPDIRPVSIIVISKQPCIFTLIL